VCFISHSHFSPPEAGSQTTLIEIQMKYIPITLVLSTTLAASLLAQDKNEMPIYKLEEIIVTAGLWDSELQKTNASVSVIREETLKNSGTQHFGDLINAIPNLTWSATSSRPRYIQVRGIGENSQFEGETPDASVRFLVDDLDFTGIGTVGNLFDTQQVEVLRGPQAGAFGVNAAGGIVQIVTNDPTPYWTGQIEATAGGDSLISGGIAIGGPLLEDDPDKLTFRFSAYQLQQDGFRDNRFLNKDDTNERDEFNTRLKLRWIANEDWQWDGTLFYADADNGYDEWSLGNKGFNTFSDYEGRDEQKSFAASLRGKWTGLDEVEITTITSFTDTNSFNSFDGDWVDAASVTFEDLPDNPGDFIDYSSFLKTERERQRWSEEIRFDSVDEVDALGFIDRWTTGIYFEDFKEDTEYNVFGLGETVYETQTLSFYGQGIHLFNQETRLIVGLRAEYYDLDTVVDYEKDSFLDSDNNPSFDDWLFGGKITLEHDLNDSSTIFASVTKGYKAGGANIFPGLEGDDADTPEIEPNFPTSYDTEDLWNYEFGLRSSLFEGALVSQLTLFYLDREDAQLRSSAGVGIDFNYGTTNAGDAEHYGAELETTWFINENWTISAGLGLLETELDATGEELSSAPSYTYNARIDYVAKNGFFANLEVAGSDNFFESNNPDNRDQRIRSAFTVFNAAVGYRYENWTLTVWGRNLFDEEYEKRVFFFANNPPNYDDAQRYENPADPQQFGVTVNYRW
jgi:iron complex outermembrane receptor protein